MSISVNGKKIRVSDRPLSDGLALFGTSPYHPENTDETFALLRKVFDFSRAKNTFLINSEDKTKL